MGHLVPFLIVYHPSFPSQYLSRRHHPSRRSYLGRYGLSMLLWLLLRLPLLVNNLLLNPHRTSYKLGGSWFPILFPLRLLFLHHVLLPRNAVTNHLFQTIDAPSSMGRL